MLFQTCGSKKIQTESLATMLTLCLYLLNNLVRQFEAVNMQIVIFIEIQKLVVKKK